WFSPSLRPVVEAMNSAQPGFEELNEREVEVGQLVTQGLTNKEIARQTGIAERTVEFYITQMFHKLQVASRVEMALWFKEHDLFGM
ncbi:MAG TPA: response regulator transcription factor, partial [Anaerolineaceae bacterium]|nr:response regulator transcription factor [Anaerolineaceae bacterium]